MTDLGDRLDLLAAAATGGVEVLAPELAVRARRRKRVQVRGGAALALVAITAATVYATDPWNRGAQPVQVASPPATTHMSPLPATSLTPAGWIAEPFGSLQVSLPDPRQAGLPPSCENPGQRYTPRCEVRDNSVAMRAVPPGSVLPAGVPVTINSIPVIEARSGSGMGTTDVIEASGYEVTVTGPLADQIVATLTYSPWSVVMNSWVSQPPANWTSMQFGGLGFSVPPGWAVKRATNWGGCFLDFQLERDTVTLSTAQHLQQFGCPEINSWNYLGTAVDGLTIGAGPAVSSASPNADCRPINGLEVCIAPPNSFETEVTANIRVPGQATWDEVEIGVGGDGTTALNILDSLHPSG